MQSPDKPLPIRRLPPVNLNPTFQMSTRRPDSQSFFEHITFPLPDGKTLTGMTAAITQVVSSRNQANPITYEEIAKLLFGPQADKRHTNSIKTLYTKLKREIGDSATSLIGEVQIEPLNGTAKKKGLFWIGSQK